MHACIPCICEYVRAVRDRVIARSDWVRKGYLLLKAMLCLERVNSSERSVCELFETLGKKIAFANCCFRK